MSSRSSEMYLPHCITCCSHTFSSWFCVIYVDLGTFLRKTWFQQRKPMAPSYCCRYTRRLTTSFTVLYTTVLTDRRMRKNPGAGFAPEPNAQQSMRERPRARTGSVKWVKSRSEPRETQSLPGTVRCVSNPSGSIVLAIQVTQVQQENKASPGTRDYRLENR
jgi:hypothetical protein